jgi:farnesyl-diphosphate farnesyltransferase
MKADLQSSALTSGLLAAVSRSFYLSLRVLPRKVRAPLSLGYLLARAADTVADVPARPAAERLAILSSLHDAVMGASHTAVCNAARAFSGEVSHEGEKVLLQRLDECFAALQLCPDGERSLIQIVLTRIIRGQSLDLERFPELPDGQAAIMPRLATAGDLDEYTWLVAGCVGEFWTEVCLLHLPKCSRLPREEMIRLGTEFGKGLQLVNILRDQPRDMAQGRCYLPADELRAAGLTDFSWPAADWKPWHAVRGRWLDRAREFLASGRAYAAALTVRRLRFAALLPLLIGESTLDLLSAQSPDCAPQPGKITRRQVKRLMLRAAWQSLRG